MRLRDYILPSDCDFIIQGIKIPNMNDEEKETIETFIDITRHIQEIEQLFRIFRVNIKIIFYFYRLGNNDEISKNYDFDLEETDDYIINCLIINYISSAKTLKESIENFMKQFIGETDEININYNNEYLNKLYDDVFAYRLLLRLRDFTQHGHLIVSRDYQNKYYFDIEQILSTPHFNINKKLKLELKNIKQEIYERYGEHPRIAFTLSVAEFNYCIIKTYKEFLETIEGVLKKRVRCIKKLLKDRPNLIYRSNNYFNGFVFFEKDEDGVHCFNPNEDSLKMFNEIKTKTAFILKKEEKKLELLRESFAVIE